MNIKLKIYDSYGELHVVSARVVAHGSYSTVFQFTSEDKFQTKYVLKVHNDYDLNELGIVCGIRHPNLLNCEWFFFEHIHEQILQTGELHPYFNLSDFQLSRHRKQLCVVYKKYTPLNCIRLSSVSMKLKAILISDIIEGLNYLHKIGMYHGDIKPYNILVSKNINGEYSRAILADFSLTYPENICSSINGSIGYSSPETTPDLTHHATGFVSQVDKDSVKCSGKVSDIWSLACVIIYMLTQKEPFIQYSPQQSPCVDAYISLENNASDFILDQIHNVENFEFWFKILRVTLEFDPSKRYTNLPKIIRYITNKFNTISYDVQYTKPILDIQFSSKFLDYFSQVCNQARVVDLESTVNIPERYVKCFPDRLQVYPETFKKLCESIEVCNILLSKYPSSNPKNIILTVMTMVGIINLDYNIDIIISTCTSLNGNLWGIA